ncbi:helix-turn-helix transcriptional regulator [Streptomyces sp. NPDC016845]|uniref:helix-turn-helix transcriptional regulator n=1 Tax=Streptomyces sp. NPDC016845 TaxID=3364972 RepID=UPI0037B30E30
MCHPALRRALIAAQHLRDLARLRRVRDRIDREYARPLNVEELARAAGMAPGRLSRQFRLAYDASPYAYLMVRRTERAMALLRRGDLGVPEVRRAVGCASSPGVFGERFTELVGMDPDTYLLRAATAPGELPWRVTRRGPVPSGPVSSRNEEATATEPQLA